MGLWTSLLTDRLTRGGMDPTFQSRLGRCFLISWTSAMDLDGRDARLGLDGPSFRLSIPHDVSEAFVAWFDAEFADGSVGERGLGTSGQSLSFSFFGKTFSRRRKTKRGKQEKRQQQQELEHFNSLSTSRTGKEGFTKWERWKKTYPNAPRNPLWISSCSGLARLQYPISNSDLPAILLMTVLLM